MDEIDVDLLARLEAAMEANPRIARTQDGLWYLREWNVVHGRPRKLQDVSAETLRDLYISQRLSTYKIAERYGVSPQLIQLRLRQYGIARRGRT